MDWIGLIQLRKLIILAKWWRWLFIPITSYHISFDDHKVLQNSSRQRMAAPRCGLLRLEGVPCAKKIVRTSSSWPCVSPEESTDPLVGSIGVAPIIQATRPWLSIETHGFSWFWDAPILGKPRVDLYPECDTNGYKWGVTFGKYCEFIAAKGLRPFLNIGIMYIHGISWDGYGWFMSLSFPQSALFRLSSLLPRWPCRPTTTVWPPKGTSTFWSKDVYLQPALQQDYQHRKVNGDTKGDLCHPWIDNPVEWFCGRTPNQ